MSFLEIQDIKISFGGLKVFSNVNINIEQNEIYGLIGTNGAGKTTLFNIICGLLSPDEGTIRFDNKDITNINPNKVSKLGLGRCFQDVMPFKSMTPLENIRVARSEGRKLNKDDEMSIDEILELTNLKDKRNIITNSLTLPDKKNVEIARALAVNPKLILFDEVASGLTGDEIVARMELMKSLSRRGITIVVVEHIMIFIKEICDRVGVLHAGGLIAEGTPEEVGNDHRVIEAYLGGSKL